MFQRQIIFEQDVPDAEICEISKGCNASMVRYPSSLCGGRDILLFANPDTTGRYREHGVVQVSFDGGETWPLQKEVTRWGDWLGHQDWSSCILNEPKAHVRRLHI